MKKRLCALLLGLLFATSQVVTVLAENGDDKTLEADTYRQNSHESEVTTGTYEKALENVNDVDEDIKDEVDLAIPDEMEEISIGSTEEFLEFARNCRLDTWSVNKKVTLTKDISLLGTEFDGIPSFGGIFDGAGHTVSAFNLDKGISYTGLFIDVQKTAVITDLNVQGSIIPSGEQINIGGIAATNHGYIHRCKFTGVIGGNDYVGGIAGVNELSGIIDDCSCSGYVHGVHFTGGIAGKNMGYIIGCVNDSLVNTTNTDTQITIDSMSTLNKVISLVKNANSSDEDANADVTSSDTGGIAGQSIGIIMNCVNSGKIGYEHVGYNVGGIAGRQSGFLFKCTNSGKILGRKDVGGIVGQAEPYITVDLSTDIAYQLSEAIGKLHDLISATLRDTKSQSNVISNRLSIIQNYTGNALNDVKFISNGTIDYANGISGAATEAFSRVDYVLDESTKKGGALDHTQDAVKDVKKSATDIRSAFSKLDIEEHIPEEKRDDYKRAKTILEGAEATFDELCNKSEDAYKNNYIYVHKGDRTGTSDLEFVLSSTGEVLNPQSQMGILDDADISNGTNAAQKGYWQHNDADKTRFPASDKTHASFEDDAALNEAAQAYAYTQSADYAKRNYVNPYDPSRTGTIAYEEDILSNSQIVLEILTDATQYMAEDVKADAVNGMQNLANAAQNLENAGHDTREILNNLAGRDNISFPTFSDEYRTRTTSFVDNMQGMNDNFGLLNSEMNNATGVLVDDLQAVNDQFNTIMLLFSDAADGVLEMDYTSSFEDISMDEADTCTDATIDSCINYGRVEGDIDVSGIAGTMAIEYEYDKESDITGIKDSKLSTSYLTKCVLRDNDNYNNAVGEKNYVGGICGLQEMGTIIRCSNMGNIKSGSGEYAGGICGRSLSNILDSTSSGILSGKSYIGGITGDGMNISGCQSLVKMENADSWYGAISGHINEKGIVRNNFFYSDELAGIDRSSYTAKAEPKAYNVSTVPYDFRSVTVTFMLEDDDSDDSTVIKKASKKYGDNIDESEYPRVDDKDGYYVVWDKNKAYKLHNDEIITASYVKYRTTIGEVINRSGNDDDIYQGEILVDGRFRQDDELIVEKDEKYNADNASERISGFDDLKDYENIHLVIPDDGNSSHLLRIRPNYKLYQVFETFDVYQIGDNGAEQLLESTGNMGQYLTYIVSGNDIKLNIKFEQSKKTIYKIIGTFIGIFAAIALLVVIIVFVVGYHRKKISLGIKKVAQNVSQKIESKEQLFYDDSEEDKKPKKNNKKHRKTRK